MKLILAVITSFVLCFSVKAQSDSLELLYHWQDTGITGSMWYDNAYNEVWGYYQDGHEYAIIGSSIGTHFFDVTDPMNVEEVGFILGADTGEWIIHRDYHDHAGYLYMVCDEGNSTLQIADLRQLPDTVFLVYDSDTALKLTHNIFIDTASALMYTCGTRFDDMNPENFALYDLSDPIDPKLVSTLNVGTAVHDAYVRNDTAFLNCGSQGLRIYDFTDPINPQWIGLQNTYPDFGYNHSGWLNERGNIYALADENHGYRIKLIDVSDISNMTVLSVFGSGVTPESIPHNLIYRGDYLFVSYYYDGLWIWDVSDSINPQVVASYDTYPDSNIQSYHGAWGVYPLLPSGVILVSDMQTGLYVFDIDLEEPEDSVGTGVLDQFSPLANKFRLWPNPVEDEIRLEILDTEILDSRYGLELDIFDISGNHLMHTQTHTQTQTLNWKLETELAPSTYILRVSSGPAHYYQKFIKAP